MLLSYSILMFFPPFFGARSFGGVKCVVLNSYIQAMARQTTVQLEFSNLNMELFDSLLLIHDRG